MVAKSLVRVASGSTSVVEGGGGAGGGGIPRHGCSRHFFFRFSNMGTSIPHPKHEFEKHSLLARDSTNISMHSHFLVHKPKYACDETIIRTYSVPHLNDLNPGQKHKPQKRETPAFTTPPLHLLIVILLSFGYSVSHSKQRPGLDDCQGSDAASDVRCAGQFDTRAAVQ